MAGKIFDWVRTARRAYWEGLGFLPRSMTKEQAELARAMGRIAADAARKEQVRRKRAVHPRILAALRNHEEGQ